MMKEEQILFPYVTRMEEAAAANEPAPAALNSNSPAQLGADLNGNSAAQLGHDTPRATVPNDSRSNDSDATATGTNVDTSRETMKHPPTNRMDEATPTEKTPSDRPAAKHPPTARMDAATPDEKSPKSAE